MKKIITVCFLILGIIFISGCSFNKTNFEDLPQEKKTEIQTKIQEDVLAPYIKEIMALAFQNNVNEEEMDKITDAKAEEFKISLIKYLNENYPDIKFDIEKISKIDNSKVETDIKKTQEYKKVALGEFYEFSTSEDEKLKLKVNDIIWKGTKYGDYIVYEAKNEFLFIRVEGENTGKKPTFKSLGDVKLITKDGYEFSASDTEQNPDNLKNGYSGCIECELNPLGKAEQWIVFDIPKMDLAGAVLKFENDLVEFEL